MKLNLLLLKKTMALIIALLCFLSVFACSNKQSNTNVEATPTPQQTNEPTAEPTKDDTPKAKVVFICGQSNAAGVSPKANLLKVLGKERYNNIKSFDNIRIVYNNGTLGGGKYDTSVANCKDKLEKVRLGQGWSRDKMYFGPEIGIAEALNKAYPNEKIYIVKHGLGSSTIGDYMHDDPISDFVTGANDVVLYDSYAELKRLFEVAVPQIKEDSGLDPEVVAICWLQGESEANMGEKFVSTYKARQAKLIENFRRDYAQFAPSNGIAFVDATIADTVFPNTKKHVWAEYERINAAKNEIAIADDRAFIVDVNANDIVCTGEPDYYHYNPVSMIKLGNLMGEAVVSSIK